MSHLAIILSVNLTELHLLYHLKSIEVRILDAARYGGVRRETKDSRAFKTFLSVAGCSKR